MLIALLLFILALSVIALLFALNAFVNLIRDRAPYVPTADWAIEWMSKNLKLKPRAIVYDPGCGDARVLVALKRAYPDIRAIGYERNWWPYILAKARTRGTGAEVRRANFYEVDLSDANLVFCFLLDSVMGKVERFLRPQLKPGATVISYGFRFPNWQPTEQITNPNRPRGSKINIYRQ